MANRFSLLTYIIIIPHLFIVYTHNKICENAQCECFEHFSDDRQRMLQITCRRMRGEKNIVLCCIFKKEIQPLINFFFDPRFFVVLQIDFFFVLLLLLFLFYRQVWVEFVRKLACLISLSERKYSYSILVNEY